MRPRQLILIVRRLGLSAVESGPTSTRCEIMAAKKHSDPIVGGIPLSTWRERLTSADADERWHVVQELYQLEKRAVKALPLLVDTLSDKDSDVRAAALRTLVCMDVEPETVCRAAEVS